MFALIITIISIALIVVTIAATMYYGGNIQDKAKAELSVSEYAAQIEQVRAATNVYKAENGGMPASVNELIQKKYLTSVPGQWEGSLPGNSAFAATAISMKTEAESLSMCQAVNKKLGLTGAPPSCSTVGSNFWGCCQQ